MELLTKEPDLRDAIHESPAAWVESREIKLANGDVYSFRDRPYLIRPMSSRARKKAVEKATQLGFSETFIQEILWGCIEHWYPQGGAYIFPNDTEMKTFVQSRFNPLIRDNPDIIGKHIKNTDTTYLKQVNGHNLFFDGGRMNQMVEGQQKESAALRGKSFDKCILDEFDLMEEEILDKVEGRMGNSQIKAMTVISNPTVENHRIDRLYRGSNQLRWFRKCGCGEWTCSDEEFPDLISKKGCHCRKCKRVLGYAGEWVAANTEMRDFFGPEAQDWEGYQISQLNSKTNSPWVILNEFRTTTNIEDFWKLRMGRAYTPKENRLTMTEVFDCCGNYAMTETYRDQTCMGVDVGKDSYHYVIGIRTGKEDFEILKVGCASSFEDIGSIAIRMGVRNCVVDIRPYEAEARRFQKAMSFRVWLCQYGTNPIQDVVWDDELKVVKCFRTGIFDITHRLVVDKRVRLPYRNQVIRDFAGQYCEPYKVKKEDLRSGSIIYIYENGNGNDHYRNAMNYFYLAAMGSKVIRPDGFGPRPASQCIHETVRI